MIEFKRLLVTFATDVPLAKRHAGREIIHAVSGVESVLMLEGRDRQPMQHARITFLQSIANAWHPNITSSMGSYLSELIQEVLRLQQRDAEQQARIQDLEKQNNLAIRLLENRS